MVTVRLHASHAHERRRALLLGAVTAPVSLLETVAAHVLTEPA